jgi:hypothetical protein
MRHLGFSAGWLQGALLLVFGVGVGCAEIPYHVVDWQLDLEVAELSPYAVARVCTTRASERDFVVVDEHFVMPGLPGDGEVQVVIDVMNDQGEWIASSGPILLEGPLVSSVMLDCTQGECAEPCVGGTDSDGGLRSLAVRFVVPVN